MKNLVIVESPSKSKTIEKYLGKDFKVVSSKGHIRDLATKGKEGLGVDVEDNFKPTYVVSKDKKDVVKSLKADVDKCDFVYLATDPDREGEAISWHLASELGLDLNEKNRIVFNEITKNAVLKALDNPRTIDMALVRSQETRRILDRVIGFKLSKLLQRKIGSKSAGRVQSIALRMICDKEKEINDFKAQEYWTINAKLEKNIDTELVKYKNKKIELNNEAQAKEVLDNLSKDFKLVDISQKKKKRSAYLPFITSTLQQEASIKLGFGSKKTMQIAQSLYEGVNLGATTQGLITYMRTDSTRLSNEFVSEAYKLIEKEYGKEYIGTYRVKNDDNSQDAHEAIRPTSLNNVPDQIKDHLTNDQYKLYKFIYYRALASLMAESVSATATYSFDNNDYLFTTSGSKLEFDGFLKAYGEYDNSKDVVLPQIDLDTILKAKSIEKNQHFTEAPARYSEAKLIKALEEEGVGRPSTYATIIDTIVKRNYVELKKASESGKTKYFFPTEQGILTDEKLREYFLSVINVKYTANMETELDEIALDKLNNVKALKEFYDAFQPLVDNAYEKMEKKELEKTGEKCPDCGGDIVIRNGRYGKFKSCINYPTCKYTDNILDESIQVEQEKLCPNCGSKMIVKKGRFGAFYACSKYPECKTIQPLKEKEAPEEIGRNCPDCGAPLLKRKSRFGNYFIGCSKYPKCKYIENIAKEKKETKKTEEKKTSTKKTKKK